MEELILELGFGELFELPISRQKGVWMSLQHTNISIESVKGKWIPDFLKFKRFLVAQNTRHNPFYILIVNSPFLQVICC